MSRLQVDAQVPGSTLGTTPPAPVVAGGITAGQPGQPGGLDAFSRAAGPDVAIKSALGLTRLYAVFEMEPGTQKLRVRVVDDTGRLVRVIPPDSVSEMITAMASYGGR